MSSGLHDTLDASRYEVETAPDVVLWGPPGTGKTSSLMDVLADEIAGGVDPLHVGGYTYTTAMAGEFADRARETISGDLDDSHHYRTTHSECFRLLELHSDDVVDAQATAQFMDAHGWETEAGGVGPDGELDDDSPWATNVHGDREAIGDVLLKARTYCLNAGLPLDKWRDIPAMTDEEYRLLSDRDVSQFNAEYEAWKETEGLVDFDDMLLNVVEEGLTPHIDVLIEDEYQDKTPLQVEVYNLWADAADTVYVAGDPFQAIYGYAGTDPAYFQSAYEMADGARVLDVSYRLGASTIEAARRTLSYGGYEMPDVEPTGTAEVERIRSSDLIPHLERHESDECMHLVRANWHRDAVAGKLTEAGIPFRSDTTRWTAKQLSLFNGVCTVTETLDGLSFGERPRFETLSNAEAMRVGEALPGPAFEFDGRKAEAVEALEDGDVALGDVVDLGALQQVMSGNPFSGIKSRDSGSLVGSAIGSAALRDRLAAAFDSRDGARVEGVDHRIDTIHASKGRESDVVFLYDASLDVIEADADRRNEARVWYVGCSRARDHLYVVSSEFAKTRTAALPRRFE